MKKKQGFIAFIVLLIISAVTVAVAVSIALLGVSEAHTSLSFKKGQETLKIAQACIEEALLKLRDKPNYSGGSLSVGDGSCSIVVSRSAAERTINVEATISGPPDYVKKIQAIAKRLGFSINIVSWQEVE